MEKYLIVDTFNGEGYSDSSAEIIEVTSEKVARQYAISQAEKLTDSVDSIEVLDDRVLYGINEDKDSDMEGLDRFEDQGAVHFVELLEDTVAISINPTINEFVQLDKEGEADLINWLITSEETEDGEELEGTCHHLDDSVEIYFKIENL
jgi:hypothetical protein